MWYVIIVKTNSCDTIAFSNEIDAANKFIEAANNDEIHYAHWSYENEIVDTWIKKVPDYLILQEMHKMNKKHNVKPV